MSETRILDPNRVLRVTDAETQQTTAGASAYKASGEVDRDKADYLEITANSGVSGSAVIKIEAKNDNETDVDLELNAKGAGTVTVGGSGDHTFSSGDLTLTTGDFIATAGDFTSTLGDLLLTEGDATLTKGDLLLTLGDLTLTAGNFVNTLGDVTVTQGDLTVTNGNIVHTAGTVTSTADGGAAAGAGVTAVTNGLGPIFKTVLTLNEIVVVTADGAGAGGGGGFKVYDFPEGHIRFLGAHINLTTITPDGTGVQATTTTLDVGLGTAAAGAADGLAGTEADIFTGVQVTGQPTAADGSHATALVLDGSSAVIDGSATANDMYLNFGMEDADHDAAAGSLTCTGTISVTWINLGDD